MQHFPSKEPYYGQSHSAANNRHEPCEKLTDTRVLGVARAGAARSGNPGLRGSRRARYHRRGGSRQNVLHRLDWNWRGCRAGTGSGELLRFSLKMSRYIVGEYNAILVPKPRLIDALTIDDRAVRGIQVLENELAVFARDSRVR
jgi:hypothetical protein